MKDEPQELRELLSRLPDAPVSSNFTARVMQAVEREELQAARTRGWRWNWHALLPRAAVAAVMVAAAGFTFYQHEIYSQRAALGTKCRAPGAETAAAQRRGVAKFRRHPAHEPAGARGRRIAGAGLRIEMNRPRQAHWWLAFGAAGQMPVFPASAQNSTNLPPSVKSFSVPASIMPPHAAIARGRFPATAGDDAART